MNKELEKWAEDRLWQDCTLLTRLQPGLRARKVRPGYPINCEYFTPGECTVAEGLYSISASPEDRKYWFLIALCFPEIYPACHPELVLKDSRYPLCEPDRHIAGRGIACLGSPGIVLSKWVKSYDLEVFLKEVVNPWLAWQVCSDAGVEAPPDLAHGSKGIYDAYRDIFGNHDDPELRRFMKLLKMETPPEETTLCPCGSGRSLRRCHSGVVKRARKLIPSLAAAYDLAHLDPCPHE